MGRNKKRFIETSEYKKMVVRLYKLDMIDKHIKIDGKKKITNKLTIKSYLLNPKVKKKVGRKRINPVWIRLTPKRTRRKVIIKPFEKITKKELNKNLNDYDNKRIRKRNSYFKNLKDVSIKNEYEE